MMVVTMGLALVQIGGTIGNSCCRWLLLGQAKLLDNSATEGEFRNKQKNILKSLIKDHSGG